MKASHVLNLYKFHTLHLCLCLQGYQGKTFVKAAILLLLSGCASRDDFYNVTKVIDLPEIITINEQFPIRLVLRNDSSNTIQLTIDDTVQKSLLFMLDFECDGRLLRDDVKNPGKKDHNYNTYQLSTGDSIVYNLKGLFRERGDSLLMEIEGYDRIFYVAKPSCNQLRIDFGGMWNPGKAPFADSREGYYFRQRVVVRSQQ